MKKMKIAAIIFMLLLVNIPQKNVQAADKNACKVTIFRKENKGMERATIYGKNKAGKVIWKYRTSTQPVGDLDKIEYFINGKYVYIFDYGTLIKVRKKDGKRMWRVKKVIPESRVVCFDSKGNIYICGYYDIKIYKVSSKGKIVWKTNFEKTSLFWLHKMKYNKGTIKIYCEGSLKDYSIHHFLYINASNGKIKKYI